MSDHVTRLRHQDREIVLVGTAHISKKSVEEVERVIAEERPDTVCVELDQTRYDALVDGERWRKLDVVQVIREGRVPFLLASLVLTAYQRKLGEKVGVRPGAEMLAAVHAARRTGARLILADRDVQATLKRSFRSLSTVNRARLLALLLVIPFAREEISEEQIERLKDRDTINEMMAAFAEEMPDLQTPLIDERDRYLMSSIQEAPGRKIVAVVGAGHVRGITRALGQRVDREALSKIPPPSRASVALSWLAPLTALGALGVALGARSGEALERVVWAWAAPNAVLPVIFTLVAGAKLSTSLAAAALGPVTTLARARTTGVAVGFVEAWLRRPSADDAGAIPAAIGSLATARRNPFIRALLVSAAATLGSKVAAWLGALAALYEVIRTVP